MIKNMFLVETYNTNAKIATGTASQASAFLYIKLLEVVSGIYAVSCNFLLCDAVPSSTDGQTFEVGCTSQVPAPPSTSC